MINRLKTFVPLLLITLAGILVGVPMSYANSLSQSGGSGNSLSSGTSGSTSSFIYSAGRGKSNKKDLSNSFTTSNGQSTSGGVGLSPFPVASEPRGDYSGGYGGSGGGYGGGHAGGSPAVYHYAIQPHGYGGGGGGGGGGWQAPVYYQDDGGSEGIDKGLIGLLGLGGLGGLKGLLGLAALAKLALPLLLLLLPILLPLLLAKAGLLLSLLLLIPIPVITTGRNILNEKEGTGKLLSQETMAELLTKIPFDISHIVARIKDSEFFKGIMKKDNWKVKSIKDNSAPKSLPKPDIKDNLVNNTSS